MTNAKHTPGPWERSEPDGVHGWVRFHSPVTSCVIVECGPHNADLVGSSPELYRALNIACARLELLAAGLSAPVKNWKHELDMIRHTLKSANGVADD